MLLKEPSRYESYGLPYSAQQSENDTAEHENCIQKAALLFGNAWLQRFTLRLPHHARLISYLDATALVTPILFHRVHSSLFT